MIQRIAIVTDNDGHDYIIPYEMLEQFYEDLERGYFDEYEEFNRIYSKYMLGGDINRKEIFMDLNK